MPSHYHRNRNHITPGKACANKDVGVMAYPTVLWKNRARLIHLCWWEGTTIPNVWSSNFLSRWDLFRWTPRGMVVASSTTFIRYMQTWWVEFTIDQRHSWLLILQTNAHRSLRHSKLQKIRFLYDAFKYTVEGLSYMHLGQACSSQRNLCAVAESEVNVEGKLYMSESEKI